MSGQSDQLRDGLGTKDYLVKPPEDCLDALLLELVHVNDILFFIIIFTII